MGKSCERVLARSETHSIQKSHPVFSDSTDEVWLQSVPALIVWFCVVLWTPLPVVFLFPLLCFREHQQKAFPEGAGWKEMKKKKKQKSLIRIVTSSLSIWRGGPTFKWLLQDIWSDEEVRVEEQLAQQRPSWNTNANRQTYSKSLWSGMQEENNTI